MGEQKEDTEQKKKKIYNPKDQAEAEFIHFLQANISDKVFDTINLAFIQSDKFGRINPPGKSEIADAFWEIMRILKETRNPTSAKCACKNSKSKKFSDEELDQFLDNAYEKALESLLETVSTRILSLTDKVSAENVKNFYFPLTDMFCPLHQQN